MGRRSKRRAAKKAAAKAPATTSASTSTRKPKQGAGSKSAWKLLDRGSTLAAGLVAREVSQVSWRAVTGKKPPVNGRHPEVATREAVAWAVVGGALVELVKLLVRRYATTYWVRSTGELPPGMKPITKSEPVPLPEPEDEKPGRKKRRRR